MTEVKNVELTPVDPAVKLNADGTPVQVAVQTEADLKDGPAK